MPEDNFDNYDVLCTEANSQFEIGNYLEAIKYYDMALKLDKSDPAIYYNKARAFTHLGLHEDSLWCFKEAIFLDPKDPNILIGMGLTLFAIYKLDESIKCFQEAIDIDPTRLDAWNSMGISYMQLELFEEAMNCFDKILSIDEDYGNGLAYYNKGCVESLRLNPYAALEMLKKAIELDIKFAELAKDDADYINIRNSDFFRNL